MQNYFLGAKVQPKNFIVNLLKKCTSKRRPLICRFTSPPREADRGDWAAEKITKKVFEQICKKKNENRYVTISTFNEETYTSSKGKAYRRRVSDFHEMVAVMIDDPGTKVPLEKIVIPPSYWLETSPNNFQAWYFLEEPEKDPAKAESVLNALVASGLANDGKDPGMKGLTRYGRLPGGWNNKGSLKKPHRVTAYKDKSGFKRYSLDEIIEAYNLELKINDSYSLTSHAIDDLDKGTAEQDPIVLMFKELGLIKYIRGSKIECTCPWVDEHTDGVDNGTALLIQPGGEIGFKCHHGSHIDTKGLGELHHWLKENHSELYKKHYTGCENDEELDNDLDDPDDKLTCETAILNLFDKGYSKRDVSLKSRQFAKKFGISSYDFQNYLRILHEEYLELESLRTLDLDALDKDTQTVLDVYKAFPKPLAIAILSKAESDRLDPSRPVQSLIPCIASQLGSKTKILVKKGVGEKEGWYEYPLISCIDIGQPSEGKSQTNKTILAPLFEIQSEIFRDYKQDKELYDEYLAISKRTGDVVSAAPPDKPPKLYVTGGTAEGIMKRVSELPSKHGMLYVCDEVAGLLTGADQYKSKSNFKNTLLTALSGPLTGTEERSNNEGQEIMFDGQTLSIVGTIQLARVMHLFDPQNDDSGFGSRFLCASPELPADFAKWSDTQVDIFDTLDELIRYLREIELNDGEPIICKMDDFSHAQFRKRYEEFRTIQQQNKEKNPGLSAFIGKCAGHLTRLILVCHWVACFYEEESPGEITMTSFKRGYHLMDYYISQFRLLQIQVSGPTDLSKSQLYLLKRLKKSNTGSITVRQAYVGLRRTNSEISMRQVRALAGSLEKRAIFDKKTDTITLKK